MIRLTPQRRPRVSNRVALIAALTLALVAYSGFRSQQDSAQAPAMANPVTVAQSDQAVGGDPAVKKRKLSISLLLFGRG